MLNDLAVAADHHGDFMDHLRANSSAAAAVAAVGGIGAGPAVKLDFSVQCLTVGHWPTYRQIDAALPSVMAKCVQVYIDHFANYYFVLFIWLNFPPFPQSFTEYYEVRTSKRRLRWVYSLGNAVVKMNISPKKTFDLQVDS
jgi:cullin 1